MLIKPTANFVFLIVLLNILLTENAKLTTTDDPANVDIDEAEIKNINHYKEMKKNRAINFQDTNRIVGGTETTIQKHPFIVSLQLKDGSHVCGGSLINDLWVLSASHCITVRGPDTILSNPADYIIVAGLTDVTRIMDHGQSREIETFIKHPNFGRPLLLNDIALIKVKNPLILNEMVQPVNLPKYHELQGMDLLSKYRECMALGWGAQKPRSGKDWDLLTDQEKLEIEGDTIAPTLRQVNLPIIATSKCKDVFSSAIITNRHLCTMSPYGGKDACEGDSGGPLMCGNLQYGVTSWGHGCAIPGTPGVFTRVDTFDGWITNALHGEPNVDPYNSSNQNATLRNPNDFITAAGLTNLTKITEHGQSHQNGTFIMHPNFSRPLLYNAIALIKNFQLKYFILRTYKLNDLATVYFLRAKASEG